MLCYLIILFVYRKQPYTGVYPMPQRICTQLSVAAIVGITVGSTVIPIVGIVAPIIWYCKNRLKRRVDVVA